MSLEETLREGLAKFRENIVGITKLTVWFTIIVLLGCSIGMLANHHYPLIGVYGLFAGIAVFMLESGISIILSLESVNSPRLANVQEKLGFVLESLSPIKKSIVYAIVALPLFIHMTVAVLGALLLFLSALFLVCQVKFEDTGSGYNQLDPNDGGFHGGVNSGDITIPAPRAPYTDAPAPAPYTTPAPAPYTAPAPAPYNPGADERFNVGQGQLHLGKPEASAFSVTDSPVAPPARQEDGDWDLVKEGDTNLLLG